MTDAEELARYRKAFETVQCAALHLLSATHLHRFEDWLWPSYRALEYACLDEEQEALYCRDDNSEEDS